MYAVVGCSGCESLWVVADRPETTECPRCGRRHQFDRLTKFARTEDAGAARQARADLLAERAGHGDADLDDFGTMEREVDEPAVSDAEYLAGSGLDPEAVAEAGERAGSGTEAGGTGRLEVVREAIRTLEAPDEDAVVAYAADRGVDAGYVRDALDRLRERGEVIEDGGYRLV